MANQARTELPAPSPDLSAVQGGSLAEFLPQDACGLSLCNLGFILKGVTVKGQLFALPAAYKTLLKSILGLGSGEVQPRCGTTKTDCQRGKMSKRRLRMV